MGPEKDASWYGLDSKICMPHELTWYSIYPENIRQYHGNMFVNTFIKHTFNKVSMVAAVEHVYAYNMQYLRVENDRVLIGLVVGVTENATVMYARC